MSVVVVGGGPAGLACAIELRRLGVADVAVLDREQVAGGIPRHCNHQGFGMRDLHRFLSGPSYAGRYVELALAAGADVRAETMVTGWSGDGAFEMTGPDGRETVRADAVVLATGCRERPRAARLVPGTRPDGVFTTGLVQQLAQQRLPIGTQALIVGAEHVSFSALLTLAHSDVRVVGMVTDLPRQQSFAFAGTAAAPRTANSTAQEAAAQGAAAQAAAPGKAADVDGDGYEDLVTGAPDSPHRAADQVKAELYFGFADKDQNMTPEQIATFEKALEEAGATYRSELYEGAAHGYTMADTAAFNEQARERHFRELGALLERTLGSRVAAG